MRSRRRGKNGQEEQESKRSGITSLDLLQIRVVVMQDDSDFSEGEERLTPERGLDSDVWACAHAAVCTSDTQDTQ